MADQPQARLPTSIHTLRTFDLTRYLASNAPSLISIPFVTSVYSDKTGGVYWTTPLSEPAVTLMLQNSSVMGIYRLPSSHLSSTPPLPEEVEQVAMARFITDHVTHAYLTDVYICSEERGKGLGTWLVECCNEFVEGMMMREGGLRKFMLATSNPTRNARFYREKLGLEAPVQDPRKHLVMVRSGKGGGRYEVMEFGEDGTMKEELAPICEKGV